MIIGISADHNGIELKDTIKTFLKSQDIEVVDFGPYEEHGKVDYNFFAGLVARSLQQKEIQKGILICGTGVGMSIVANRYSNVRAVLAHNLITAEKSREHNDSNVLCLGAWVASSEDNISFLNAWLKQDWGGGRHSKRVNMIDRSSEDIVLTNGVFDVLHRGHIELLKFCKAQGARLVVALDADHLVAERKGPTRPINSLNERRALLESISYVDEVVRFDSPDELKNLYEKLKPSVIVKGSEWTSEEVRLRDEIPSFVTVKTYPIVESLSTTATINKIKSL